MPRADSCCGSAGVYNVVQNEISMKILDEKMDYVAMVEAGDRGDRQCGLHAATRGRSQAQGPERRVEHVIELLDEAY